MTLGHPINTRLQQDILLDIIFIAYIFKYGIDNNFRRSEYHVSQSIFFKNYSHICKLTYNTSFIGLYIKSGELKTSLC